MAMFLRQSTASQEIVLGRFVDSTDGNTEETALTIANTDIKLWVEGATTLASKNSGGATHIANGMYYAVLDATDTATLGKLEVSVHVAGALAIQRVYMVLPAMVYDSLVLGTDYFQVDAAQWLGQTIAAVDTNGYPKVTVKDGTGTGEIDTTSGRVQITEAQIDQIVSEQGAASPTVADLADAVWDEARAGHVTAGSFGEHVLADVTKVSGDATAADNAESFFDGTGYAGTGNTIPTVTTVTNLTNAPTAGDLTATMKTSVTTAATAATPTAAAVTGAVGSVTGNVGGNLLGSAASIAAGGIAANSFAAGAIDAAAIAADAIGASELAAGAVDEIWDELIGDSTVTVRQALKLFVAALGGKLSGAATTTIHIRNVADDTDVILATVDANGNRSAVTLSL